MNTLVMQQTDQGEVPVDVYQKLANDRILFLTGEITDEIATDIIATLFLKDQEDPEKKITLFINSPGGDIRNTLMIYDVMSMLNAPVETVCIGRATDESAVLLSGGAKGMRMATKNAIISVSQLIADFAMHTNLIDAKNLMEQLNLDNNRMMEIISKATGKTIKQCKTDFDRRVFFSANQAVKYGLIDKVIS